jgi:hypothetical protein
LFVLKSNGDPIDPDTHRMGTSLEATAIIFGRIFAKT